MVDQEKNKITYTKEMIVKNISRKCGKDTKSVKDIYNALEHEIEQLLSSANPDTDVTLRLFEGISISSTFVPEQTMMNNLTGKMITSSSKIRPKVNITRRYCEKITDNSR